MHNNSLTKPPKHKRKSNQRHLRTTSTGETDEAQHGYRKAYLLDAPQEVLTYCTSFLEPQSLLLLSKTCRRLREHIEDDNTWRRAFEYHFYGITPESSLDYSTYGLMLRRTNKTWKNEFILRVNLLKQVESRRPMKFI
jgi:F-box-like